MPCSRVTQARSLFRSDRSGFPQILRTALASSSRPGAAPRVDTPNQVISRKRESCCARISRFRSITSRQDWWTSIFETTAMSASVLAAANWIKPQSDGVNGAVPLHTKTTAAGDCPCRRSSGSTMRVPGIRDFNPVARVLAPASQLPVTITASCGSTPSGPSAGSTASTS
ncbi:Uncharacterised protein [Mycobacteroides abscessus subsp. abscessus]|nr:Uncharacterised protein [Mycobacteroides abscessus subsp. abscessus]